MTSPEETKKYAWGDGTAGGGGWDTAGNKRKIDMIEHDNDFQTRVDAIQKELDARTEYNVALEEKLLKVQEKHARAQEKKKRAWGDVTAGGGACDTAGNKRQKETTHEAAEGAAGEVATIDKNEVLEMV